MLFLLDFTPNLKAYGEKLINKIKKKEKKRKERKNLKRKGTGKIEMKNRKFLKSMKYAYKKRQKEKEPKCH